MSLSGLLRPAALAVLACAGLSAFAQTDPGDAERGRAIYEGRIALTASTTGGAPVPGAVSACVQCHRPSGMGGFEGRIGIAPITGRVLFKDVDPDTAKFFPWPGRVRIRPAYDAASLGHVLRTGVAPDGQVLRAPMPLYALPDADVRDLVAYLRGLSTAPTPGIDATTVRIATITTPGADPERVQAMLTVLRRFEASRNSQTRREAQRGLQASQSRFFLKDSKFRRWNIVHWALEGEPAGWPAQLERHYEREPVFGVLTGMGVGDWSPVEAFCEGKRVPCILPQLEQVPDPAPNSPQRRFYSLYFHGGLAQDLGAAIAQLTQVGVHGVEVWMDGATSQTRERVTRQLLASGLNRVDRAQGEREAVLSLLPPEQHLPRWQARGAGRTVVAWVPGARWLSPQQWNDGVAGASTVVLVSPLRPSEQAAASMQRAAAWLRSQGLQALPLDVASTTLYASTVFGETFMHLDFDYTREYMLELLEHGLESMIPLSPFPRLTIGPEQRVASKGSYVGLLRDGAVSWQWQSTVNH